MASKKIAKKVKKVVKKKVVKKVAKKKAAPKKNDLILITSPAHPQEQIYVASEMADDALIEQELSGDVVKSFIYQFKQGGKDVMGLSAPGVNEAVRKLAKNPKSGIKIRIEPSSLKINRDVEYNGVKGVEVSVYANNLVSGEGAFGIKFEPYEQVGQNGKYPNTFAVEKALSKAERNAKRKLIPEKAVIAIIAEIVKNDPGSVKLIAPAPQQPAPRGYQNQAPAPQRPKNTSKVTRDSVIAATRAKILGCNNTADLERYGTKIMESTLTDKEKSSLVDLIDSRIDHLIDMTE